MILALGIIAATVVSVIAVYLATRALLNPDPDDKTSDLAGKVLLRIAALHGLVLALVFASEVVEYHQLSFESAVETNAISDAYYDAGRYGHDDTAAIREALHRYIKIAATTEWARLGDGKGLQSEAWSAWDDAYNAALNLVPETPRQDALRDNMLTKIHVIAANRDLREHHAKISLDALFWVAALAGILLMAVGFYPFPPTRENIVLLSTYSSYTGLILFVIFAMANPYASPAALDPVLFQQLLEEFNG